MKVDSFTKHVLPTVLRYLDYLSHYQIYRKSQMLTTKASENSTCYIRLTDVTSKELQPLFLLARYYFIKCRV